MWYEGSRKQVNLWIDSVCARMSRSRGWSTVSTPIECYGHHFLLRCLFGFWWWWNILSFDERFTFFRTDVHWSEIDIDCIEILLNNIARFRCIGQHSSRGGFGRTAVQISSCVSSSPTCLHDFPCSWRLEPKVFPLHKGNCSIGLVALVNRGRIYQAGLSDLFWFRKSYFHATVQLRHCRRFRDTVHCCCFQSGARLYLAWLTWTLYSRAVLSCILAIWSPFTDSLLWWMEDIRCIRMLAGLVCPSIEADAWSLNNKQST